MARALLAEGWNVIGIGRDPASLAKAAAAIPGLRTLAGSVANDTDAARLAADLGARAPRLDAIVVSVNRPAESVSLMETGADKLLSVFADNIVTHHCAIRALLPLLAPGGRYIGIGGGTADLTLPGTGPVSACQAAQRNLYRFYALENPRDDVSIADLMLYSHIVDPADEDGADPRLVRADEVGTHLLAVLDRPADFAGPILTLKSRKQVGQPERQPGTGS